MILLPNRLDNLRVVGVDPGTVNMGIASLEADCCSNQLIVADAFTVIAKDTDPAYRTMGELHGARVGRLMNLSDRLLCFLREYQPHAVVVESNYMGASVDSFRSLVESVCMVRNAVYQYNPLIPLHTVDPRTVKQLAGLKGRNPDKEAVREALRHRPDLKWKVDIDELDEHSIDAIPIGLYFAKHLIAVT